MDDKVQEIVNNLSHTNESSDIPSSVKSGSSKVNFTSHGSTSSSVKDKDINILNIREDFSKTSINSSISTTSKVSAGSKIGASNRINRIKPSKEIINRSKVSIAGSKASLKSTSKNALPVSSKDSINKKMSSGSRDTLKSAIKANDKIGIKSSTGSVSSFRKRANKKGSNVTLKSSTQESVISIKGDAMYTTHKSKTTLKFSPQVEILEEEKEGAGELINDSAEDLEKQDISDKKTPCDICKYYCTLGPELFHVHAQEPWPKDVKLFQPYEVEQILLPDNANCLAVQAFLKMCGLDFKVECRPNAEYMSPSGKVPFIKAGAFVVAELEGIVQFVNSKGISLSNNLSVDEKSDMRAYMSLVHNVLENAELYICWCDKETYNEVTKARYGSVYPWPLNHIQNWSKRSAVIKRLKLLGWYDKSLQEVYQEVENCCKALTDRLEGKEYFFGNNVSELDALVYAHIRSILTNPLPPGNNEIGFMLDKYTALVQLCKRIDLLFMGRETDLTPKFYKEELVQSFEPEKEVIVMKQGDKSTYTEEDKSEKDIHSDTTEIASDFENIEFDMIDSVNSSLISLNYEEEPISIDT